MSAISISQPDLARWLPWADPMPSREAEEAFLRDRWRDFDADKLYGFAVIEEATSEIVGTAGLHPKVPGLAEIGYWVRSDRTGRGYATAAARRLTTAAFEHLSTVSKVIIRMDRANQASAAIPRKLGFVLEETYEYREIVASGHTGHGLVWSQLRAPGPPPG